VCLKEVGVLTSKKPREAFERRTMRCVSNLEKNGCARLIKQRIGCRGLSLKEPPNNSTQRTVVRAAADVDR